MSRNEKFWVDQVMVPYPPPPRGTTRGGERQGVGGGEQLCNPCPIPAMHTIVRLLAVTQIPMFSPNKWDYHMHPALVGPIMAAHLKIKEFSSCA